MCDIILFTSHFNFYANYNNNDVLFNITGFIGMFFARAKMQQCSFGFLSSCDMTTATHKKTNRREIGSKLFGRLHKMNIIFMKYEPNSYIS